MPSRTPVRTDRTPREQTPESLALRAQAGSTEAYSALVLLFQTRLYNFLLRRVGPHDAEDVAQEAFVRAWQRINQYSPRWRFSTWLFTIALRAAATHARRSRPRPAMIREHTPSAPPPTGEERSEDSSRIWSLVDECLTDEQRTAVWLRYVEDLSMDEIGVVMGKSAVAVRVMLHRARATLAQRLEASESLLEAAGEAK